MGATLERPVAARRNLAEEPLLELAEIQSDLLLGHGKDAEALIFFEIIDSAHFRRFVSRLAITSAAEVFRPGGVAGPALLTACDPPTRRLGVAFTFLGLNVLGAPSAGEMEPAFVQGLAARAVGELNDPMPTGWIVGGTAEAGLHGVFVVTGKAQADVDRALHECFDDPRRHGYREIQRLCGHIRSAQREHEHFGFLDGVSQPGIRGVVDAEARIPLTPGTGGDPDQGAPGQDLLWPGEFVFGYPEQDPGAATFTVKGPVKEPPVPWMRNGAFLVVRRLAQKVPEFHKAARLLGPPKGVSAALLEAQMVGRHPDGAPLLPSPDGLNDFEFGGDRGGNVCPWAAHIRKAYPRDDVRHDITVSEDDPEDLKKIKAAEAFTQTHRMLRRGIPFGPDLTTRERQEERTIQARGLLFKCYVTSIDEQFEFVQKQWCNSADFSQPGSGIDPIIGQAVGGADRPFLGAGMTGSKPGFDFRPWVEMTGGGYFFAPSIGYLRSLHS